MKKIILSVIILLTVALVVSAQETMMSRGESPAKIIKVEKINTSSYEAFQLLVVALETNLVYSFSFFEPEIENIMKYFGLEKREDMEQITFLIKKGSVKETLNYFCWLGEKNYFPPDSAQLYDELINSLGKGKVPDFSMYYYKDVADVFKNLTDSASISFIQKEFLERKVGVLKIKKIGTNGCPSATIGTLYTTDWELSLGFQPGYDPVYIR